MEESRKNGKNRNPCLTMHQPWASLLVHGIKRIEGRSWPAPIRGYVHALDPDRDKLDPCSIRCISLGYSRTQKGYKCYSPSLRRYFVCVDVTFNESLPFFSGTPESEYVLSEFKYVIPIDVPPAPVPPLQVYVRQRKRLTAPPVPAAAPPPSPDPASPPSPPPPPPPPSPDLPIALRKGRIWIHAAGKVPDAATIKAMEDFYREIYSVNGITDLKFPQQYPVSRLIGCIEVVGCLRREELACWNEVPEGVRLEALTDFCWLCEQPQKLRVPIEMRGFHGVYDLERKIYEAAMGDLIPVDSSLLVKFRLPNPQDPFSLKPGSISACFPKSKASEIEKSSSLSAAIAAASAAATQYTKKGPNLENNAFNSRNTRNFTRQWQLKNNSSAEHKMVSNEVGTLARHHNEGNSGSYPKQFLHAESSHRLGPHSKIFAAAVRGLRPE